MYQLVLEYIMLRAYGEELDYSGKLFKFTRDNDNAYKRHSFVTLITEG